MTNWAGLSDSERREAVRDAQAGATLSEQVAKYRIDPDSIETFGRQVRAGVYWYRTLQETTTPAKPSDIDPVELADAIRNKPTPLRELSSAFDRSEESVRTALKGLTDAGYNVIENQGRAVLDTHTVLAPHLDNVFETPCMELAIGAIADLHMGSTKQQMTWLHEYTYEAYGAGVRNIFVAGDLVAGNGVYQGQEFELWAHGAEEQKRALVNLLPRYDGLRWHVIGGNHDYSFVRSVGYDIPRALARERSDVSYYGFNNARVKLTDNTSLLLWHPKGRNAYAVGYRLQKGIEQEALQELMTACENNRTPTLKLVLAGHLHTRCYVEQGGIDGYHCGCFEGRTELLKAMAVYPSIGGWVLHMDLEKSGAIRRCKQEFIKCTETEDDWLAYRNDIEPEKLAEAEPLFEWRV